MFGSSYLNHLDMSSCLGSWYEHPLQSICILQHSPKSVWFYSCSYICNCLKMPKKSQINEKEKFYSDWSKKGDLLPWVTTNAHCCPIEERNQNLKVIALNNVRGTCNMKHCPGRFLGITSRYPSVPKSNRPDDDIFQFPFIKLGYIL